MSASWKVKIHVSASRIKGRFLGASAIAVAALIGATIVPTSPVAAAEDEGAASATTQSIGVPGSLLDELATEQIAAIDGSTLVHRTSVAESHWAADGARAVVNSNAIEHQKGIDANLLGSPTLPELSLDSWSELSPSLIAVLGEQSGHRDIAGCGSPDCTGNQGRDCDSIERDGDTPLAVIVGNSVAAHYMPTIRAVLEPAGWQVESFAMASCGFVAFERQLGPASKMRESEAHKQSAANVVVRVAPELLISATKY